MCRKAQRHPAGAGSFVALDSATCPLSRVERIVHPDGYTLQHRYTAWSGQLDQLRGASTLPAQTFGYDVPNRLTTQDGANIATYDAAGNLQTRNGGAYTYLPPGQGTSLVRSDCRGLCL